MTLYQLMNMKNRVAVVTGATGHLGKVISSALAEMGADLLLVDQPGSNIEEVVDSLVSTWKITAKGFFCDFEKQNNREKLLKAINTEYEKISVLVNNAAFVGSSDLPGWAEPFEKQAIDTWQRALEVNLTAAFDLSKGLAPLIREGKNGSIINIASIYGSLGPDWSLYKDTGMASPAAYAASKGGLVQLTRWMATTLAPKIRVNAISPGGIFRNQPENFVKRYEACTPMKRMANEDDVKGAIAFFASDLSLYVTGQNLLVDGGWSAW